MIMYVVCSKHIGGIVGRELWTVLLRTHTGSRTLLHACGMWDATGGVTKSTRIHKFTHLRLRDLIKGTSLMVQGAVDRSANRSVLLLFIYLNISSGFGRGLPSHRILHVASDDKNWDWDWE